MVKPARIEVCETTKEPAPSYVLKKAKVGATYHIDEMLLEIEITDLPSTVYSPQLHGRMMYYITWVIGVSLGLKISGILEIGLFVKISILLLVTMTNILKRIKFYQLSYRS